MEHYKNLSLEDIEGEVWISVKGWEGMYEVSSCGRIKSLKRICLNHINGKVDLILTQGVPKLKGKDYAQIGFRKNKKWITIRVHRLVATHFIPNPDNKPCVNHKDGNKLNNHIDNLEWCTYSENTQHAFNNKLIKLKSEPNVNYKGVKVYTAKLTEKDIIEIRKLYKKGFLIKEIKIKCNLPITLSNIEKAAKGITWKHI